jgi:hypothetical protein
MAVPLPILPDGKQVISVTIRTGETPNYTFWVRWAKNPKLSRTVLRAGGGSNSAS